MAAAQQREGTEYHLYLELFEVDFMLYLCVFTTSISLKNVYIFYFVVSVFTTLLPPF